MASAAGYAEDYDLGTGRKNEELLHECFHIRFKYLKSEEVVEKCFIEKLPPYITPEEKSRKIWKGWNPANGEYYVTFEQSFKTARPASLEDDVHNTWISNKPSTEVMACMVVSRTTGNSIEENAYSVVFQGGFGKSHLYFEKYHGIHYEMHNKEEKYLPRLLNARTEDNHSDFEERFIQQWNLLRTRYRSVFHGDLSFSIRFGTFYVMNIKSRAILNVLELNKLFDTIDQRKKKAFQMATKHEKERKLVKVPYSFSFHPIAPSDIGKLHKIIERVGFTRDTEGVKKKILIKFKHRNVGTHDFDENGKLYRVSLSQNRWLMATVLPAILQSSSQITSIRYGLKSYRNVDMENVDKINFKLLKTGTNEYQLQPSCNIHDAIEKVTELYSLTNWFGESKVKLHITTATKLNGEAGKLVRSGHPTIEVLVLPEIPNLDTSEEELRSYARHIWKWAIYMANELKSV